MPDPGSSAKLVTVFGGSGFVGRYVVQSLARRGHRIRVAVRRPDLAGHLQPLGTVGQIKAIQANLRYRWSVDRAVEGADAVVNLVGILAEGGRQSFDAVQGFGPRAIGEAARAQAITEIVHLSAIGVDQPSTVGYLRSKAEGEAGLREVVPEAIILRPSIVFGPEDGFFNRFAAMARLSPVLPLIGGGATRFQPVFVGDVAKAIADAVDGKLKAGTTYELGGPEVRTFKELLQFMLATIERKRLLVPLPFFAAKIKASFLQFMPSPLTLTPDQVELLRVDNVVSDAAIAEGRTLPGIGIEPEPIEAIVSSYLWRFRKAGQFSRVNYQK
jgi:uncharacterized protein YbjT (DUF2867 family)